MIGETELLSLRPGALVRVKGIGPPLKFSALVMDYNHPERVAYLEGYDHRGGCRSIALERLVKVVRHAPTT